MKKTILTILWMIAFFLIGSCIFVGFGAVIVLFMHHPYDENLDSSKMLAVRIVAWLVGIGLPILALILGIREKLPGTRSRKSLVQT